MIAGVRHFCGQVGCAVIAGVILRPGYLLDRLEPLTSIVDGAKWDGRLSPGPPSVRDGASAPGSNAGIPAPSG
jgi:hypothetical protein